MGTLWFLFQLGRTQKPVAAIRRPCAHTSNPVSGSLYTEAHTHPFHVALERSEKVRPTPRLEYDAPFNGDTAHFYLHIDVWFGFGNFMGLDNHHVFIPMVLVFMVIIRLMTVIMIVVVVMVFMVLVVLVVFLMFVMLLMMTAMPWRAGRDD